MRASNSTGAHPQHVRKPRLVLPVSIGLVVVAMLGLMLAGAAMAAGITGAAFSGGAGTAVVGGTLYAKSGAPLTLTATTDTATSCVTLSGTHSASSTTPSASDSTSKTWTFSLSAAAGADGTRSTTVTALDGADCVSGAQASVSRSYSIDNTPPVVSATRSPAPNSFGWNNSDITVTWSATDAGSGVASGPTPATDGLTSDSPGVNKTSTATDRVGNVGTGSMIIKLDKTPPTISGARNPAANGNGWNNTNVTVGFTCSDGQSGIQICPSSTTISGNVTGQSVNGTTTDFASNSTSTSVVVSVDKNAPTISGAPSGSPNSNGWYNADVTIVWTCNDTGGSGFAAGACASSTISAEGTGQTLSKSVTDLAGNSSPTATSSPAVNLDKTAPSTTATSATGGGGSTVSVTLAASDGLSGVASTMFRLDGGSTQTYGAGNVPTFTTQGSHTLEYWSVDKAGNSESHHTFSTSIDSNPPTITITQTPLPNVNGWNNSNVTLTFACADSGSGVASCPTPVTLTADGAGQPVSGTAFDNAGNSASASTTVSIDKTAPSITGQASPPANSNGWNSTDVVVTFSCSDALSGVATCPPPQTVTQEGAAQSVTGTAVDRAGNTRSVTVGSINIDKAAPVVSVSGVSAGGTYQQGAYSASCSTSDARSGVATAATMSTSGGPTGSVTLTCAGAVDRAGNSQTAPVSVQITVTASSGSGGFNFGGFLPPVAGNGAINHVWPGSVIAIRFSLGGFHGMHIFADGYPASVASTCSGTPPSDGLQRIDWPWGPRLWYNASTDTYGFYWFTAGWWSGCRTLVLKFSDGSTQVAYFQFDWRDHHHGHSSTGGV